ncbi:MAG: SCO family protein [Verrucomicrobiaceae bacterium]|nr:MAG: SCO family protein [Verrucomicrobiaceae bacterium]
MNRVMLLFYIMVGAATAAIAPPEVGIDQNLGVQLPMDRSFRDDVDGRERPLGDYFTPGRPAILVMGYFRCPQLCSVVMNALVESLTEIRPRAGRDYDVFFVSVDPTETAGLGARKKRAYVRLYGKPETTGGWHFLSGESESIAKLAEAVGFRYVYDYKLRQFAHGSGIAVVTPTGKVSRYFYGIEYPAKELAAALREARQERQGSRVEELLLMCYHYNPITGPYGMAIWRTLQGSAALTLGALGFFIIRSVRQIAMP